MGNVMVSLFSSVWAPERLAFTGMWVGLVIYILFKILVNKPWGSTNVCRRSIDRCEVQRKAGFADWKSRVDSASDEKVAEMKHIVELPLLELRGALQKDTYTAVQVLEAYVWKALQVQDRINCCTETIKEAFDIARAVDEEFSGKSPKPVLYGVPFSVKGNFYMKGYDCCIGLAKLLDQPKSEDCSFVTHLRNLGAVPFVITNIPQGLLSFVCTNSVYGTTGNPHDITRTPGGSSGGEAALLAAGGSPFGIGSDLAGSLRIPATMCGLVSLKPTQDRFVVTNTHGGVPGRGRLGLSFGFFTKTVEEQIFLLKTTVGTEEYRKVTPLSVLSPLNSNKIDETAPLKIGYYDDDGFCSPVPSMRRSVIDTVEKLKMQGHTLVRFTIPDVDEMITTLYKLLMPDGGAYIRSLYDNDIVDPLMRHFVMLLKVPRSVRWFFSLFVGHISPQLAAIGASYISDLEDLRYTQEMCDLYREKFVNAWKSLGIDALICPAFPVAAVPNEYPARLAMVAPTTALFNLIDFPAGVVPTGKVTQEDDEKLLDEKVFPVGYNLATKIQRDASRGSVGLPTAVQIVTLPFEEEMCLRVMKEVEKLWKE